MASTHCLSFHPDRLGPLHRRTHGVALPGTHYEMTDVFAFEATTCGSQHVGVTNTPAKGRWWLSAALRDKQCNVDGLRWSACS